MRYCRTLPRDKISPTLVIETFWNDADMDLGMAECGQERGDTDLEAELIRLCSGHCSVSLSLWDEVGKISRSHLLGAEETHTCANRDCRISDLTKWHMHGVSGYEFIMRLRISTLKDDGKICLPVWKHSKFENILESAKVVRYFKSQNATYTFKVFFLRRVYTSYSDGRLRMTGLLLIIRSFLSIYFGALSEII